MFSYRIPSATRDAVRSPECLRCHFDALFPRASRGCTGFRLMALKEVLSRGFLDGVLLPPSPHEVSGWPAPPTDLRHALLPPSIRRTISSLNSRLGYRPRIFRTRVLVIGFRRVGHVASRPSGIRAQFRMAPTNTPRHRAGPTTNREYRAGSKPVEQDTPPAAYTRACTVRTPNICSRKDLRLRSLRGHGGEWEGEPNVLHKELKKRGGEALPERPDESSKMVLAISKRGTWLKAQRGWGKKATSPAGSCACVSKMAQTALPVWTTNPRRQRRQHRFGNLQGATGSALPYYAE